MRPSFSLALALSLFTAINANAESHVIKFVNQCGYGYPALMLDGNNVLTGDQYTSSGPFSGIAYLQTGFCNTNGENCTLLETTLINPTCAGCGSSTDISLIPPHAYSVETSFAYYDGCDGIGQTCDNPNCSDSAFFIPNDNFVQVECQATDVALLVAFCGNASTLVGGSGSTSPSSSLPSVSSAAPTPSSSVPAEPKPTTTPTPTSVSTPSSTPTSTPAATSTPTPSPTLSVPTVALPETSATVLTSSPPVSSAPPSSAAPPTLSPPSSPSPSPSSSASPSSSNKQCRPRPSSTPQKREPVSPRLAHRRRHHYRRGITLDQ